MTNRQRNAIRLGILVIAAFSGAAVSHILGLPQPWRTLSIMLFGALVGYFILAEI